MARVDELRLMAKVARLYYERGLKQTEIAKQLDISSNHLQITKKGRGRADCADQYYRPIRSVSTD
jgi:DNA-directed RNA polymerase specialized sigma24 family protein